MNVEQIRNSETLATLIQQNQTVVIDFYAEWCGPCKRALPEYQKLPAEFPTVVFTKVNVDYDEEGRIVSHFKVGPIPLWIVIHRGEVVERLEGYNGSATFDRIRQLLGTLIAE
jgi:thioredoxin 1